jgi:alcohol dehydrogenase class IV
MRPEQAVEIGRHEMTRYLISFDEGAMTFPEEDLPDVAEAASKRAGAKANPRPATRADIEALLRSVW